MCILERRKSRPFYCFRYYEVADPPSKLVRTQIDPVRVGRISTPVTGDRAYVPVGIQIHW